MKGYTSRKYQGIPLGMMIRGSIAKSVTFRIRKGDGNYGTKIGEIIQDKYDYYVPSSINNPESAPRRAQWKAAVEKWKYGLTPVEKAEYNARVTLAMHMSGYNLFMREAMGGLVDMFVDRGDPATFDFDKDDFTKDGTWRNIDISAIIPVSAKAILIGLETETPIANKEIIFRKYGNSNPDNHCGAQTLSANKLRHSGCVVAVDNNQRLDYKIDSATWTTLDVLIRGWWT